MYVTTALFTADRGQKVAGGATLNPEAPAQEAATASGTFSSSTSAGGTRYVSVFNGKDYLYKVTVDMGTPVSGVILMVKDNVSGSTLVTQTVTTAGTYTLKFKATSGGVNIQAFTTASNSGKFFQIDDVIIEEDKILNPGYKFGFNGKEKDDETYGGGNCYDYGFRIYNSRLGKFLSVDPLTKDYAMLTPYQFASNLPTRYIDLDGLEAADPMYYIAEGFRQYFDAAVNAFSFDFSSAPHVDLGSSTSSTRYQFSLQATYGGWDLFKPDQYPVNNANVGSMPAPIVTLKAMPEVKTVNEVKQQTATATVQKREIKSSDGSTSTTTSASKTVMTNSGVPVTATASNTTSSNGTSTNTAQVSVGPSQLNAFAQISTTTSGKKTTSEFNAGVQSNIETPFIGGIRFGVESVLQVGIKLK